MVSTDCRTIVIFLLLYLAYWRRFMHTNYKDAEKWDMLNKIINTVRQFAGLPLRPNNNPYKSKKIL